MRQKNKDEKKIIAQVRKAANFEISLAEMSRKSERRAWIVAISSLCLTIIFAIVIALLFPLKTEVPFVVISDTSSGMSIVARLHGDFKNNAITSSEAINKSNVANFVKARESYDWELTNIRDWSTVIAMSDPSIATAYTAQFQSNNKYNPNVLFGQNVSIRTVIRSIILTNDNNGSRDPTGATVYFDRYKYNKGASTMSPLDSQIATLAFVYKPQLKMNDEYRYINPLGFQVIRYQTDTNFTDKPKPISVNNFALEDNIVNEVSQQEYPIEDITTTPTEPHPSESAQ